MKYVHRFSEGPILVITIPVSKSGVPQTKRICRDWYGTGTARHWEIEALIKHLMRQGFAGPIASRFIEALFKGGELV